VHCADSGYDLFDYLLCQGNTKLPNVFSTLNCRKHAVTTRFEHYVFPTFTKLKHARHFSRDTKAWLRKTYVGKRCGQLVARISAAQPGISRLSSVARLSVAHPGFLDFLFSSLLYSAPLRLCEKTLFAFGSFNRKASLRVLCSFAPLRPSSKGRSRPTRNSRKARQGQSHYRRKRFTRSP
jgi:hypothetical protein